MLQILLTEPVKKPVLLAATICLIRLLPSSKIPQV